MTLTNALIAINVVVFVWELATGGVDADHGWLRGSDVVVRGEWWRVVTAAFLHGSITHIAFNMFALYQVGTIVERAMGPLRYLFVYACAIVGSGAAVIWFNYTQPTLGASGAIFGLFGALVAIGLSLPPRGMSIVTQTVPIIVINLGLGFVIPNISVAAHVGGLITGFVVGWLVFQIPSRYRDRANVFINGRPAYAAAGVGDPGIPGAVPFDPREESAVETIEQPPDAGPHEEEGAPPLEIRDPRE
ncbi:MAG TPA: rhomboid family intramembrane serine protease [Candidatus Limnocylindrales bacterium]|nr:rhomboid family intramembrane serine protease [Candidatus Limnocylindrales bacterium]